MAHESGRTNLPTQTNLPAWWNGRHRELKILGRKLRAGSNPAAGTILVITFKKERIEILLFKGKINEFSAIKLLSGEDGYLTYTGSAMSPIIKDKQIVRVQHIKPSTVFHIGDIVFCQVKGMYYVRKISAIKNSRYLIAASSGKTYGWISRKNIFGRIKLTRKGVRVVEEDRLENG